MGVAASEGARRAMEASRAQAESLVCGPAERPHEEMVAFYRLGRKFVDNERSVPKETGDILYYTLSIGHHTGVIDCFDECLSCPVDVYRRACALMPKDSPERYKLEGILRCDEIQVDQSDLPLLAGPIRRVLATQGNPDADADALATAGSDVGADVEASGQPGSAASGVTGAGGKASADAGVEANAEALEFLARFADALDDMAGNTAIYLMGRRHRP